MPMGEEWLMQDEGKEHRLEREGCTATYALAVEYDDMGRCEL